jgi:hypothetical protein
MFICRFSGSARELKQAVLLIVFSCYLFCEPVPPVIVNNSSVARTRIPPQVIFEGVLENTGEEFLKNTSLTFICLSKDLKPERESAPFVIPVLAAKTKKDYKVIIKLCPMFSAYKIKVKYTEKSGAEKEFSYFSDIYSEPRLENFGKKDDASLMLLSHSVEDNLFTCYVKNNGELEAEEVTADIIFLGEKKKIIKNIKLLLNDGKIKNGETLGFKIKLDNVPEHHGYQLSLKYCVSIKENTMQTGPASHTGNVSVKEYGEFTASPEVEVAKCRFINNPDKTLKVVAKVRNGKPFMIKDVNIDIFLLDKDGREISKKTYLYTGEIKTNGIKEIFFSFPAGLSPLNYRYEAKYTELLPE